MLEAAVPAGKNGGGPLSPLTSSKSIARHTSLADNDCPMISGFLTRRVTVVPLALVLTLASYAGQDEAPPVLSLQDMSPAQRRVFLRGVDGDWRGDTPRSKGAPPPAIEKRWP